MRERSPIVTCQWDRLADALPQILEQFAQPRRQCLVWRLIAQFLFYPNFHVGSQNPIPCRTLKIQRVIGKPALESGNLWVRESLTGRLP